MKRFLIDISRYRYFQAIRYWSSVVENRYCRFDIAITEEPCDTYVRRGRKYGAPSQIREASSHISRSRLVISESHAKVVIAESIGSKYRAFVLQNAVDQSFRINTLCDGMSKVAS